MKTCSLIFVVCIIPAIECILGGVPARYGKFPYMAGLMIKQYDLLNCGGAIISSRLIITTAHCICHKWSYEYYYALVGTNYLRDGGYAHELNLGICHELFKPKKLAYDIGLVRTVAPVIYSPFLKYISLQRDTIPSQGWFIATGWGCLIDNNSTDIDNFPDDLRYNFLAIIDPRECKRYYIAVHFNYLCSERDPFHGTCGGDSGGPVVYNGKLAGLAYGGGKEAPDIFVKVSAFKEWIDRQIYIYNRDENGVPINEFEENDYSYNIDMQRVMNMMPM